jgi:hypothetical protein
MTYDIVVQPQVPVSIEAVVPPFDVNVLTTYIPSGAESKTKLFTTDQITTAGNMCAVVPASGKKIYLLMAVASSAYISDTISIQYYKSGAWAYLVKSINGGFFIAFPSWDIGHDAADGVNARLKMVTTGTGPWSGFFLWYEE